MDAFPPEKRGAVFAITGITMIFAPIIGPTLGGLITDHTAWRWIFYINVPVGLLAAFLVWRLVETDAPRARTPIDYVGLGLVILGIAALQIVLDKGQQEDWFGSPFIVTWALVSFVCLGVALIWLWGRENPIIDLSLFRSRGFASGCILIFCTGFALYSSSMLLPRLVQTEFGYTATLAGMVLSPAGFVIMGLMPLSGRLISRVQARYMIFAGLTLASFGMYLTSQVTPQTDFHTFVLMRMAQVVDLPFLFIPISTLAFAAIPRDRSNKASALFALFRNIGGSVGIAIAYQARHAQMQQHHLAEHLVPGSMNYESYRATVEAVAGSPDKVVSHINHTLETQAAILSYADTFTLMSAIFLTALIAGLFILPNNRPATPAILAGH